MKGPKIIPTEEIYCTKERLEEMIGDTDVRGSSEKLLGVLKVVTTFSLAALMLFDFIRLLQGEEATLVTHSTLALFYSSLSLLGIVSIFTEYHLRQKRENKSSLLRSE